MADFSITIANSVNTFGPAPSDKWAAYEWNAFTWGEGTADLATDTHKVLGESVALSDTITAEAAFVISISNALAPTGDMGAEYLTDAAGYAYVFPDRVTDAEDRAIPTWTASSGPASGWSSATAGSTNWS